MMAWDRTVTARVVLDITVARLTCANREADAVRNVREALREEFGHRTQITIIAVHPEGDWCGTCMGGCCGDHDEGDA